MEKLLDLLKNKEDIFPELLEYSRIIKVINDNKEISPDISIESSKSLLEGLCKFILSKIDSTFSPKDDPSTSDVFKQAIEKISENNDSFEPDFTSRNCAVIQRLSEIRNQRGEISHGRAYPTEEKSSQILAEYIIQITEATGIYVLTSFFDIETPVIEEILYENNPEFNEYLDEMYPELTISYSKALYDQDPIAYNELLEDYKQEDS